METSKETDFGGPSHFVGYAWETVFCADNTVIERVKGEFNGLFLRLALCLDNDKRRGRLRVEDSRLTYITDIGGRHLGLEFVVCKANLYGVCLCRR